MAGLITPVGVGVAGEGHAIDGYVLEVTAGGYGAIVTDPAVMNPWAEVRTLADLGGLTAQWLEGSLRGESPWYGGEPDSETFEIGSTLAALNRIGFVTTNSQPAGGPAPDWSWAQRAAVSG